MTKKLRDYIPALKYGAKVGPEDLAGMIGLPYVGQTYFIDPSAGSDSNGGLQQNDALKTVAAVYDKVVSGQNDTGLIVPTGGTGRTSETTAINWAKRFTHLVGNGVPTMQDVRSGVGFGVGGSLVISENGVLFKNLTFFSSANINETVSITGSYSSFQGCDFKGTSHATAIAAAAWRALNIDGGQENTFYGCTFGADTFARTTNKNATIEFENAASRNTFIGCDFVMQADHVNPVHILLTGTTAIDRDIRFIDSSFYAFWANDVNKITAVVDASAQSSTGHIRMIGNVVMQGASDWEASNSGRIFFQPYTATANAIGIAINPSVI